MNQLAYDNEPACLYWNNDLADLQLARFLTIMNHDANNNEPVCSQLINQLAYNNKPALVYCNNDLADLQ